MMTFVELLNFALRGGPSPSWMTVHTPRPEPDVSEEVNGVVALTYELTPQQLANYARELFLFDVVDPTSGKWNESTDAVRHAKRTVLLEEQCPNFRDYLVEHHETGLDGVVRSTWVARPWPILRIRARNPGSK